MRYLLLLSGPLAVGKSTVASELTEVHGFRRIGTGQYLVKISRQQHKEVSRRALQELGDKLDLDTEYRWVVDDVAVPEIEGNAHVERWLFDSVRKRRQVEHFHALYGNSIIHAHLTATEEILRQRYEARWASGNDYAGYISYDLAIAHPNEAAARGLSEIADLVIDVSDNSMDKVAATILRRFDERGP